MVSTMPTFFFAMLVQKRHTPGVDPGFQVRGGALKHIAPNGGRRKMFGVIRVKNHDFTQKNHIFSNFRRERPGCAHPPPPSGSAPAHKN